MAGTEPRIMFVTRKWAPAVGGMETYSMRLTEALRDFEAIEVVALRGKANGMPPGLLALLAFPFAVLIRFLSRRTAPAVLHVGDMALWPVGLLGRLGSATRIVLSAHGTDAGYQRRGGLKGRIYGAYLKLGSRLLRSATVIANSRATAEALAETGWSAAPVVPLATDLGGPMPDGTHNGRILFVGRLKKLKGLGWFVREVLPLIDPETTLDVAGTAWDASERAALDDPRVHYLGQLGGDDLVTAYREAMCVIAPNISTASGEYEGFGLVAPESASCGAYLLAADRDGLRDAVLNGRTGFLIESGNAKAWADAVERCRAMTPDDRAVFLKASVEAAREVYCWERVARDTYAAYGLRP
ncbi:glycosyltransferase family 4 protein [Croceicoccus sediminis]|uniref:glycosyltransferase family 4 protein n=1 Tax=Croceicoccus sediminis TaxID=2571150 RepID=UPI0011833113|nr:glycosyltransferase family 4 protein [Croceicoccus sediminis]